MSWKTVNIPYFLFFLKNVKRCPWTVLLAIFEEHETDKNLPDLLAIIVVCELYFFLFFLVNLCFTEGMLFVFFSPQIKHSVEDCFIKIKVIKNILNEW